MADMFSKSYNQVKKEWDKIGKLYVSPEVVEKGNGFDSCLGFYDPGKKVMVKRRKLSDENLIKSEREFSILEDFEKHENILNWVTLDKSDDCSYMSEERWSFTLEKLVNIFRSSKTSTPLPYPKPLEKFIKDTGMNLEVDIDPLMLKLMEDVAKGLNHFHKMGFFHRDLNPQNVVIVCGSKSMTAKIANFCTAERISIKPKAPISHYSTGFQPREQIKNNNLRKLNGAVKTPETSAVDYFSFGCLLFYSLTLGEHPFGAPYGAKPEVMDSWICRSNLVLHHCRIHEAETLFPMLLQDTPTNRISITSALNFPLFWCFEKRLAYLTNVSEMMEQWGPSGQLIETYLNQCKGDILGPALDWGIMIDPLIINYIDDPKNPNPPSFYLSVRRLVRVIRNQRSHYLELPPNIKALYKGEVQGIEEYYRKIFPRLLIRAYDAVHVNIASVNAEFGKYMINYHA